MTISKQKRMYLTELMLFSSLSEEAMSTLISRVTHWQQEWLLSQLITTTLLITGGTQSMCSRNS